MYDGPPRAGNRGGQGEFRWDAVKQDEKHRENYLGHSVNAPAGRWQKNKDVHWYSRDNDPSDEGVAARERRKELKALKEAEEEALSVALGFAPSAKKPEVDMQEGSSMPRGAKDEEIERLEKEERKREKELRKEHRALQRAEKELRREEKEREREEARRSRRKEEGSRHGDEDRSYRRRRDEDMDRQDRVKRETSEIDYRDRDRDRDRNRWDSHGRDREGDRRKERDTEDRDDVKRERTSRSPRHDERRERSRSPVGRR